MSLITHASVIVRNALSACLEGYLADRRAALTSEDGGIGMQAAVITGALVVVAVAIGLVIRSTGNQASASLDALNLSTTARTT